jgi:hypothetical protein
LTGWNEDAFPPSAVGNTNVGVAVVDQGHTGKSVVFTKTANRYFPVELYRQTLPPPNGKTKLNISAWVKAQNVSKATIQVFFNFNGPNRTQPWGIYVGPLQDGGAPANHDWKQYGGSLDIPPGTESVDIALEMYGPGSVSFDDVVVNYQ